MRKELLVAIFLGGFLGLAVAFGIWRFTNSFSKSPSEQTPSEVINQIVDNIDPNETSQPNSSASGLSIIRPREYSVSDSDTIQIAGLTRPNSTVLIIGEEDYVLNTGSGTFEQEIEIAGGINQIPVYVFTEGQGNLETSLLVTYSDGIEEAESSSSILGTITDITQTSLQIRTSNGEIAQLALSDATTYVSTVQKTKDITFEDLAIGDFIAAIGILDEDDVLTTKRIIVSSPIEKSNDVIAYGTVQTLTSREFIVKSMSSDDEWSVDATKRPVVTGLNDKGEIATVKLTSAAEEGEKIIIIGKIEDDELVARRIHIL